MAGITLTGLSQVYKEFGHLPAGQVIEKLNESNLWLSPGGVQTTQDLVKNGPLMVDDDKVLSLIKNDSSYSQSDLMWSNYTPANIPPPKDTFPNGSGGNAGANGGNVILNAVNWVLDFLNGIVRNMGFSMVDPLILPLLIIAFIVFFWRV